ncbi:hypothetical protein ACOSQ3_009814 [Xanthoceras sorbifolium]
MASSSSNTCQQTQTQQSQQSSTMDFSSLAKTLHFNLPIKLDKDNYIYWKIQILSAVNALDLEEYIDSSKHPPPQPQPSYYNKNNSHNAAALTQAYIGQSSQNSDHQNTVSQGFHQEGFQPQGNYTQTSAYVTALGSANDPSWSVDSGATNHITSDLNNLSLKSEYKEFNELELPYQQLFPSATGLTYFAPTSAVPIHTIVDMVTSNDMQPTGSQPISAFLPPIPTYSPVTSPIVVSPCQPTLPTVPGPASIVSSIHPMVTRSKNEIFKPKAYTSNCFLWLLLNFTGWLARGSCLLNLERDLLIAIIPFYG